MVYNAWQKQDFDAGSIEPILAWFCHIMAYQLGSISLKSISYLPRHIAHNADPNTPTRNMYTIEFTTCVWLKLQYLLH